MFYMSTSTTVDYRLVAREAHVSLDDVASYCGISRHLLSRTYLNRPERLTPTEATKILRAIMAIAAHRWLGTVEATLNQTGGSQNEWPEN